MTIKQKYLENKLRIFRKFLILQLVISVVACFVLISCSTGTNAHNNFSPKQMTILYINDLHGHLMPFTRFYKDKHPTGGVARLAAMIKNVEEENLSRGIDTLLLSAGDNFQGTPMSTAFNGQVEFEVFNKIGLDATVVGNHDFDYGYERLKELQQIASFPLLSANIYKSHNSDMEFKPYVIKKLPNGLKVGIIGLSTMETPITTHPLNVSTLRFSRPELAMQRYVKHVDSKTDVLIVLSHLGVDKDKEIARLYPEIDVIVGGHTHTKLADPIYVGRVMICQTGDNGIHLGRINLSVENDRAKMISNNLMPVAHYISEDAEVKGLVEDYNAKLSAEIGRVVGYSKDYLNGERPVVRRQETNLGNLISDLMRKRTKSDVALINSGGIRASIKQGDVTLEDVIRAFPMNNQLVTMDMTGQELYMTLSQSARLLINSPQNHPSGGFLQVSGVSFTINRRGGAENIEIAGEPVKLLKTYKVVTLDFLAAGGDGYKKLKTSANQYNTGITLQDTMVDYLVNRGFVSASVEGRIRRK